MTQWVYLELQQFLPAWDDVEADAVDGSRQRDPADQQHQEHQVGEGGGKVHHLHSHIITIIIITVLIAGVGLSESLTSRKSTQF